MGRRGGVAGLTSIVLGLVRGLCGCGLCGGSWVGHEGRLSRRMVAGRLTVSRRVKSVGVFLHGCSSSARVLSSVSVCGTSPLGGSFDRRSISPYLICRICLAATAVYDLTFFHHHLRILTYLDTWGEYEAGHGGFPECACLYIGQSPYSSVSAMSFPPDATCLIGLNLHDIHVLHPPRSTRSVDCGVDSYLTSSLAVSSWPSTSLADCADLSP